MEDNTKKKFYKKWWFWVAVVIVLFILIGSSGPKDKEITQQPVVNKKEIKMLWDIPMLMNKSHNQITKILGNPTMIQKLSDGKSETFKFINNEMQSFLKEDLPARIGMKTTVYNLYYKESDCGKLVCGNDLSYSYTNPDQPIKYFFIDNYPVGKPASTVDELKKIGNLDNNTDIKVIPALMYDKKSVFGIDICEKNYQGSEYEVGSENCAK